MNNSKKKLKKNNKEYSNVRLYVTSEAVTNDWCTDYDSSSSTRIADTGTTRCN